MSEEFVRLPPDSTGKRIFVQDFLVLNYVSGTIPFLDGDPVIGQTSGFSGIVSRSSGSTAAGIIYVLLDPDSAAPVSGENIQVEAVTYAVTSGVGETRYVQPIISAGGNNPFNHQTIDDFGAAAVRFAEGSPQFDAFGNTRVSSTHTAGDYVFDYDDREGYGANEFLSVTSGAGTSTYLPNSKSVKLTCGTTSGDLINRTTNKYHTYTPGCSQLITMTITVGDVGKTNVRRRWGYYDDDNGIFFELDGTNLYAVLRSSTSGSVVERRVLQSDWNSDTVDGQLGTNNKSTMNLDPSKINVFWMDFQWLGGGQVRTGVMNEFGVRITAHCFLNANNIIGPYMSTGSLPIRIEQENTGTAASGSEVTLTCSTVQTESGGPEELSRTNINRVADVEVVALSVATVTPLLSVKSSATINTYTNRLSSSPNTLSVHTDQPIKLEFWYDPTLTGAVFSSAADEALDVDTTATAVATGSARRVETIYLGIGSHRFTKEAFYSYQGGELVLPADGDSANSTIFSITGISTTTTAADVELSLGWYDHNT